MQLQLIQYQLLSNMQIVKTKKSIFTFISSGEMLHKHVKHRNSNRIWNFQGCWMCKILEDRKSLVWHHLIMKERQGNVNTTTSWKSSTNQSFKQRSDNVKNPWSSELFTVWILKYCNRNKNTFQLHTRQQTGSQMAPAW